MASGEYTFYPKFSEFVTLYRGVVRVWIADGTSVNPGTPGKLYAEYIDGIVTELGYVSDYEEAKKYFADLGIQLTYPEWVAILAATPENAKRSEAWAVGKQAGVPVAQDDETHNNNARFYADQSKIWANGNNLDGTSVQPTDNATFWANEAHGWANNKQGDIHGYSATNNAEYWAKQSKGYTNGNDLDGDPIAERATDNAEYFKNQAKLWANNGVQGDSPGADNNARNWAEQAKSYSDGKSLDDQTTIRGTDNAEYYKNEAKNWVGSTNEHASATDNAIYWKNQSKLWANNGVQGDTPGANNNSRYWAEQSKSFANGNDLSDQPVQARKTDNAEYFKDQSKLWANFGTDGESPSATNNAKSYAANSEESNLQSESWTKGTRDGNPDVIRPNAATDNASYYNDQSKLWANFGTDGNTPSAANNSKAYSEDSNEFERQSESWAKGTRDGVADNIRQNASTDNSKAYSELARNWANFSTDGETPTASNNAKAYSENSNEYERQAESWARGTRDDAADTIRPNASTDNSLYYSEQSKLWANYGTDGASPSVTNNAKAYAGDAETSAQHSEESNLQSESWARGTRDGQADVIRPSASTDNSFYYSNQSKLWANFGTDGEAPTANNNAKEYARQAGVSAAAASASETHAAESDSHSTAQAADAAASAQAAATSESNAATSETNAAASETNAATSESNAATSETNAHNSELAAARSKSDAAQHESDAKNAKDAAETAQAKAEEAMSHYPRIKNNDNWEVWNVSQEDWEDTGHKSIATATTTYAYQNSSNGTVIPTGTWTSSPNPQEGLYIWIRMTYTWTNGRVDNFYNVSYIGVNGEGSVSSVNGMGGAVVLDGKNINVDNSLGVKETIYNAFQRIGIAITNAEIDQLF